MSEVGCKLQKDVLGQETRTHQGSEANQLVVLQEL